MGWARATAPRRRAAAPAAAPTSARGRLGTTALAAALGLALVLGTGCDRKRHPRRKAPPPPEPIVPTAAAGGGLAAPDAAWFADLPEPKRALEAGATVWAAVPEVDAGMASVGVFTLEAIRSAGAVLVDRLGQKQQNVPPALLHPVARGSKLTPSDVALCYSWTTGAMLARVLKVKQGHVLAQYDWAGTTKQAVVEHAEPMRTGIEPLAFVGFPKFGRTSKGLLVALADERAWVLTDSGHVEVHRRGTLSKLAIRPSPYHVGDPVAAYSWTGGFEPGTIKKVLEPRTRYQVALAGDRAPRSYFFTDLVPAQRTP